MRLEMQPGLSNVVRFPIERRVRVSIDLLRDIAPDVREVGNVAAAFGYEQPDPGLRDRADQAMAAKLCELDLPVAPAARGSIVDAVFSTAMDLALAAIDAATVAGQKSNHAQATVARMIGNRGYCDEDVQAQADGLTRHGALTLLQAHVYAESALGAWRAAEIARKGERWIPRDATLDHDWLWQAHAAASGSGAAG